MPSWPDRYPRNAAGAFYVDTQCLDCDLCQATAPMVFCRDNDTGNSYVAAQPQTPEEFRLATQAAKECPCDAIGWDGEPADAALLAWFKAEGIAEVAPPRSQHGATGCRCHSRPEIANLPKMTQGRPLAGAFGVINMLMGLGLCWFALASFSAGEELRADSRIRATLALVVGTGYIVGGAFLIAGWKLGKVLTILFGLLSLLVLIPMGFGTVSEFGWSWGSLVPFGLAAYWIACCVLVFRSRVRSSYQV